ncbi:uncharacterized protein LOC135958167 [Calliphora vicina]|uniref:uncharacterized protein LOC135958167 n=1 Tax=Calliphora vicina TaxID=7373 RepID=UPI00325BE04B
MARSEAISIKLILWILLLQALMAAASKSVSLKANKLMRSPLTARSLYDQYTLGQVENGAKIIYTYQYAQSFDGEQQDISLDFHYPDNTNENYSDVEADGSPITITQIQLYVKAEDGATTQAYVTEGGIGENNISLQIIANNSNLLNYMLVIYGTTE